MAAATDERLIYEILSAVGEIPEGNVATYGQIARLIGRPKNARLVGRVLSQAERYGDYPCHRVVDHSGRLVPGWDAQAALLAREGVTLRDAQHVDLRRYQWRKRKALRTGWNGGVSASQKSLAEVASRRRQKSAIIFSHDMCVRENTFQAASVDFVRHRRTKSVRSRLQAFWRKTFLVFRHTQKNLRAERHGGF